MKIIISYNELKVRKTSGTISLEDLEKYYDLSKVKNSPLNVEFIGSLYTEIASQKLNFTAPLDWTIQQLFKWIIASNDFIYWDQWIILPTCLAEELAKYKERLTILELDIADCWFKNQEDWERHIRAQQVLFSKLKENFTHSTTIDQAIDDLESVLNSKSLANQKNDLLAVKVTNEELFVFLS